MIKIKNLTDKAELYIWGDIITDTEASWLKREDDGTLGYQFPAKIKEQLDALDGLPIEVHLASDGGDVAAGIAIYNMLASHNAPVTVYIDSWAASIASVIAFAGQKVVMPENTFLMVHNPRAGAFGESDYLLSVADWLDKIKNMLIGIYAKVSGKTVEDITAVMDAETWFTAKEALDFFGDIIEVVDANEVEAVASLKSKYKVTNEIEQVANEVEQVANEIEPLSNEVEPLSNKVEQVTNEVEPLSNEVEPLSNKVEQVTNEVEPTQDDEVAPATNEADIIKVLLEAYQK